LLRRSSAQICDQCYLICVFLYIRTMLIVIANI
jgi:hypothetical protein